MPPIRSARAPVAPPRRPRCQLDAYMRTKLVELKTVAGWTYKQIHEEYPSIPINTIKTTVSRAKQRINNETSSCSGRPRKLDEDDKSKLLNAIDTNPRITYDDLLATVDNKVKRTSIWRLLHEEGRRKWLVLDRPGLTPGHAAARLQWAREYEHFTPEEWARVFWSDECSIERGIGERREYTFTPRSKQILARDIRPSLMKGN